MGLEFPCSIENNVKFFNPISDRIMRVEFLTDRGVVSVVIAYGPTNQNSEEEKNVFNNSWMKQSKKQVSYCVVVLGDSMLEWENKK